MSLVVDGSVALAWTLPDELSPEADVVLDRVVHEGGHIPFHFPAEFANGLTMAMRRGRIDERARNAAYERFFLLDLARDIEGVDRMGTAIELADRHRLTIYDALYLELAQRLALPLATLDDALARATMRAGVPLAIPLS